jgi:hypothetical protein
LVPDFDADFVPDFAALRVPDFAALLVPDLAALLVPDFAADFVPASLAPPDFVAPFVPLLRAPEDALFLEDVPLRARPPREPLPAPEADPPVLVSSCIVLDLSSVAIIASFNGPSRANCHA